MVKFKIMKSRTVFTYKHPGDTKVECERAIKGNTRASDLNIHTHACGGCSTFTFTFKALLFFHFLPPTLALFAHCGCQKRARWSPSDGKTCSFHFASIVRSFVLHTWGVCFALFVCSTYLAWTRNKLTKLKLDLSFVEH